MSNTGKAVALVAGGVAIALISSALTLYAVVRGVTKALEA
jgi:hypothetical protein